MKMTQAGKHKNPRGLSKLKGSFGGRFQKKKPAIIFGELFHIMRDKGPHQMAVVKFSGGRGLHANCLHSSEL